jgi:Family of unknown function (DUF6152)
MKSKLLISVPVVVGLLALCGPAIAHHGNAGYDMVKMTILKSAKITAVEWTNPHCEIDFDAPDEKGNAQHWIVEAPPPSELTPRKWTRKSLNPGDEVTVYFHASKNGALYGIMQKVIFANGDILRAYPDPK